MFLVSRLLLCSHHNTHLCLGAAAEGCKVQEGDLPLLPLVRVNTRDDPDQFLSPPGLTQGSLSSWFPPAQAGVTMSQLSQWLGRPNPFPVRKLGSVLCRLNAICCLRPLGAPACLSLAQPGFGIHRHVPPFCIHGKCQPGISRSAPRDKAGHDLCVLSLKR